MLSLDMTYTRNIANKIYLFKIWIHADHLQLKLISFSKSYYSYQNFSQLIRVNVLSNIKYWFVSSAIELINKSAQNN